MAHDARHNPIAIRSMSYASTRRPRLGVVLHFLCTGISLFHMDVDDNVLKGGPEEARLRAWQGIKAESLAGVFAKAAGELEDADIAAAQDLIRWCLQHDPAQRPQSMVQVRCQPAAVTTRPLKANANTPIPPALPRTLHAPLSYFSALASVRALLFCTSSDMRRC